MSAPAGSRMSGDSRPAFGRIAIVNRGESAMRLINAVREWNAEGRPALRECRADAVWPGRGVAGPSG